MARLNDLLSEDTNQFGPGTDLVISVLAFVLVVALITSHYYQQEKLRNVESEGNFRLASEAFTAADFHPRPVTRLLSPRATEARVARIVRDYRSLNGRYPFIFVIGHSNQVDDPDAPDHSPPARRQRNMEYALRRAVLIAGVMQKSLDDAERERLVAVTTGEADLRDPQHPLSRDNAWVEIAFGKEWKIPRGHR